LADASIVGKPRPLLPTSGWFDGGPAAIASVSLGEKLRVSAEPPVAGAADSFAPVMLIATSAMKRGVGM
jgi:hypothetical protein